MLKIILTIMVIVWMVLTLALPVGYLIKELSSVDFSNAKDAQYWSNITTLSSALIGAFMIAISIAVTSYFSHKQVSSVRQQISQAEKVRLEEKVRLDEIAIIDFEHMYFSYLSFSEHIGFELAKVESKLASLAADAVMESQLRNEVESRVRKTLGSRYKLPERPQYFDRISPIARSGYSSLLRMDSYMESHTEYLLSTMKNTDNANELIRFLKGRSSLLRDKILLIKYGLEELKVELSGASEGPKFSAWRTGFILKPHEHGFLIETIRFPKMRIVPNQKVSEMERGENWFKPDTMTESLEDVSINELAVKSMERTLNNLFHYVAYEKNISEVNAPEPSPVPEEKWLY